MIITVSNLDWRYLAPIWCPAFSSPQNQLDFSYDSFFAWKFTISCIDNFVRFVVTDNDLNRNILSHKKYKTNSQYFPFDQP